MSRHAVAALMLHGSLAMCSAGCATTLGSRGLPAPPEIKVTSQAPAPAASSGPEWTSHLHVFQPKARMYFDVGHDDPGELDIFHDGALTATVDFVSLAFFHSLGATLPEGSTWGPAIGIGITSPANDSSDGSTQSSGAPVVLATLGIAIEFPLFGKDSDQGVAIDLGWAYGISPDESLSNADDSAIYFGFTVNLAGGDTTKAKVKAL